MQGQILFDLPEDQDEFMICSKASNYRGVINEIRQEIRSKLKYSIDKLTEDQIKVYEDLRERINILIDNYQIQEILD